METLIASVKDWPALAQALVASALYGFITFFGKKIVRFFSDLISKQKKTARIRMLNIKKQRLRAKQTSGATDVTLYLSGLWFMASRYVILGFILITLGLIFADFGVFGSIGFLGALIQFLLAYEIVKPIEFDGDIKAELASVEKEIEALKNS